MLPPEELSETELQSLISEFIDDDTIGILLTGSFARTDSTRYSDVDFVRVKQVEPATPSGRYRLVYRNERLCSISVSTLSSLEEGFSKPEKAIWIIPALRQARIMVDKNDTLLMLKQKAESFTWEHLEEAATAFVNYDLMGYVEEVHKILSGLVRKNTSASAYGTNGLVWGVARIMAVHHRLFIKSENYLYEQAQEAVGVDELWSNLFRIAAGYTNIDTTREPSIGRAIAALKCYRETVKILDPILSGENGDVARKAAGIIEEYTS